MPVILMRHLRSAAIYKSSAPGRENDYGIFLCDKGAEHSEKLLQEEYFKL
jgi:hypothetical protein